MKNYIIVPMVILAALLAGCTAVSPADDVISDTDTACDAVTEAQAQPLWESEGFCLIKEDGEYVLYERNSRGKEPVVSFMEYHTANYLSKDGSEGTRHLTVLDNGDGTVSLCALDEYSGYTVVQRAGKSLEIYGDFTVIDGILHTPGMRVRGEAVGEPLEESPRYDGIITFENMRCYFAPAVDGELQLVHESDSTDYLIIADGVNGQKIGLYKEENQYRARVFAPDLGEMTKYGTYVREVPVDADVFTYGEYTVVKAYETSFVIDKDGEVVKNGVGAYLWRDGYFVFDPFDNMAPMTLYNRDFSLFCESVSGFRVIEDGVFACVMLSEYRGDVYNYDDDYCLRMYNTDGEAAEYGVFDELIYFSERYSRNEKAMCCAFLKNDRTYALIESDGREVFSLDAGYTVDFYGTVQTDNGERNVIRFIFSDNSTRDIDGCTKYTEYAFDTSSGEYEVSEYYKIPEDYRFRGAI